LGAALVGTGAYCARKASRRYRPLAVLPALFGVQQISEGFVWVGLGRDDPELARTSARVFLFFALAFWPFWLCLCAAWAERVESRRRLWWVVTALATGWFVFLYWPIFRDPASYLTIDVAHHSIRYDYFGIPLFQVITPLPLRILYVATCGVPLGFSSDAVLRWFGAFLGLSAVL